MFINDSQRKAVMAKYNSFSNEVAEIRKSNSEPLFPLSSPFSKSADRGSVPLLESTFVIRGGNSKERKKVKEVLDMIGEDPSMLNINQIRISEDVEIPISFEGDKTIEVNEEFLKGGEYDVGIMMLATAYRMKHPEIEEGREYAYAKEVVEPKVKEKLRLEAAEREKRNVEVHTVEPDVDSGITYETEVDRYDGSDVLNPIEAKITVHEKRDDDFVDDRDLMVGVSGMDDDNYKRRMEEEMKKSIYFVE